LTHFVELHGVAVAFVLVVGLLFRRVVALPIGLFVALTCLSVLLLLALSVACVSCGCCLRVMCLLLSSLATSHRIAHPIYRMLILLALFAVYHIEA